MDCSEEDIHICGKCRKEFRDIDQFILHKKQCLHKRQEASASKHSTSYGGRQTNCHESTKTKELLKILSAPSVPPKSELPFSE